MLHAYKVFVINSEGKKPPGRPRCRRKDNIKIHLGEISWEDEDWIHLAQD
jgi:hypothetical protein